MRELDRMAENTPKELQAFGAPTILIDGRDVEGEEPGSGGARCRLYRSANGSYEGAPSVEHIADFLREFRKTAAERELARKRWIHVWPALPAMATAMMPKRFMSEEATRGCPACQPAVRLKGATER